MEIMALLWLVNELTHSPFMATLTQFTRMAPTAFFSFLGGVTVDRVNRRNVLIYSLLASAGLSFALMVLVRTGHVAIWNILLISALVGVATSFNHPARQTMVPNLVKREHLMNAISLDTISVMGTRVIATPIAGYIILYYGMTPVFGLRAAGAIIAIFWLLFVPSILPPRDSQRRTPWRDLKNGFEYLRGQPIILGHLAFWGLPMLANATFTALLPAFSKDILEIGPAGYGMLQAAMGLGAVISLLGIASLGKLRQQVLTLLIAGMGLGAGLIGFALSSDFVVSLFLAVVVGGMNNVLMVVNNTIIQQQVSDQMRGRVMSLREVVGGTSPGFSLLVGSAADMSSPPMAALGLGVFTLLIPLLLLRSRRLREL